MTLDVCAPSRGTRPCGLDLGRRKRGQRKWGLAVVAAAVLLLDYVASLDKVRDDAEGGCAHRLTAPPVRHLSSARAYPDSGEISVKTEMSALLATITADLIVQLALSRPLVSKPAYLGCDVRKRRYGRLVPKPSHGRGGFFSPGRFVRHVKSSSSHSLARHERHQA